MDYPDSFPPPRQPEAHPILVFVVAAAIVLGPLMVMAGLFSGEEPPPTAAQGAGPGAREVADRLGGSPPIVLSEPAVRPQAAASAQDVAPPLPAGVVPPELEARSALVMDLACGAVLYGLDEHERLPPASLTKMITALEVVRRGDLDAVVEIDVSGSQMARRGSSVMGIEPGMKLTVRDLLFGLLLSSGNDAALALARYYGAGDEQAFVEAMNARARALGMRDTHFTNPHGLDNSDLYSTAYDMALAGRALLQDPLLAEIVATPAYEPAWELGQIKNGNRLLQSYDGAFGVKIGFTTRAKETMVAAAEVNGRRLLVSILASDGRYADASRLLDWAFASLSTRCPG